MTNTPKFALHFRNTRQDTDLGVQHVRAAVVASFTVPYSVLMRETCLYLSKVNFERFSMMHSICTRLLGCIA